MTRKICVFAALSLCLLGLWKNALAADFFVRSGAAGAGDGSDWTNAWSEVNQIDWASLAPGDSVYLAGGTYTSSLNPSVSGTASGWITVKKATLSDHGTGIGWQEAYAGVAEFIDGARISIDGQSYIHVDGGEKYGIVVKLVPKACGTLGFEIHEATNIIFENAKIDGNGDDEGGLGGHLASAGNDTITLRGLWIASVPNDGMKLTGSNYLIEDSIIGPRTHGIPTECCSGNVCHADGLEVWETSNVIFRNNVVDWGGDGFMIGAASDSWQVYGNVFHGNNSAIKVNSTDPPVTNMKVFNNSITGNTGAAIVTRTQVLDIQNNLFFNSVGAISDESNMDAASDPFVGLAAGDYHLKADATAIDAGVDLGSPYEIDPDGSTRGADGAWDIGAYEYHVPRPCADMGGICCETGMGCAGGHYASSTDCGLQCCLEGSCTPPMEELPDDADAEGPGETEAEHGADAVVDAVPDGMPDATTDDAGPGDTASEENGEGGSEGCGCAVVNF